MRQKKILLQIIIVSAMLVAVEFASAQEINVSLETRLPDTIMLGRVYTSLFRVTNLDYKKGADSFVNVTVNYSVTRRDGTVYYSSSFSKMVNSYSYASTGYLFLDELGDFQICGFAADTRACANFSVVDPMTIPCSISINLTVKNFIYSNNERVDFKNILVGNGEDHPFIIEYWIEDLLGNVEKNLVNTSSLSEKTFTPKTDEIDRVYVIKNRLSFVGCNNSNPNTESKAYFAVKNQDYKPEERVGEKCPAAVKKKATISSFYTRTKKYHEEINIFANIKTEHDALLLLKGKDWQEWQKIENSSKLAFLVKAEPGFNFYQLEVYVNDVLEDDRSLVVNLEPAEARVNEKKSDENILNMTTAKANISSSVASSIISQSEPDLANTSQKENGSATGFVAYISKQEKASSLAGYLVAFACVFCGIGAFARLRR